MNLSKFTLKPALPSERLGEIKDLAQQVIVSSATLEGRVAKETATAIGDVLRLLNSYHSNLIEGHKTSIIDIESALNKDFSSDSYKRYNQELYVAHVLTEKNMMDEIIKKPPKNICQIDYICKIHKYFYSHLPKEHQFTQSQGGFTKHSVNPGILRDTNVSLDDGNTIHGPNLNILKNIIKEFVEIFNPEKFHGDEKMIATAASHHRLAWLHPFRDGNGRVARLFTGLYLALIGVNQRNLWSLPRGFSRDKKWYRINLQSADLLNDFNSQFNQAYFADYIIYFFEVCLDQINFMDKILALTTIEPRIDWFINIRNKSLGVSNPIDQRSGKLLKALFNLGEIPRGKAGYFMGMTGASNRSVRRVVSQLIKEGLVVSETHRAPLKIGLPTKVLKYYFPDLFDPSIFGE